MGSSSLKITYFSYPNFNLINEQPMFLRDFDKRKSNVPHEGAKDVEKKEKKHE